MTLRSPGAGALARVVMIQDGARLHYAIPAALQRAGVLERVYTDFYIASDLLLRFLEGVNRRTRPGLSHRIAGRHSSEIDRRLVHGHAWHAVVAALRRPRGAIPSSYWVWVARHMGDWILRQGFGGANVVMAFVNSADPRVLRAARARGLVTVGDQMIAPIAVEIAEARLQHQRWPGWEPARSLEELERFEAFQRETWQEVDHFTCASEYVRDGLLAHGIPRYRISVLPYPVAMATAPAIDRTRRDGPVVVGFVGDVSLRKGAPYFFEVARHLNDRQVKFKMVGLVRLHPSVLRLKPGNVEIVGHVPRSVVQQHLASMDVLLFPSTCEGSSGVVSEAMASGLPVVVSPNSGSVARDGIEGFIRPYDDTSRLAECVRRLVDDRELRMRMGHAAQERILFFDLDQYSRSIAGILQTLVGAPSPREITQ